MGFNNVANRSNSFDMELENEEQYQTMWGDQLFCRAVSSPYCCPTPSVGFYRNMHRANQGQRGLPNPFQLLAAGGKMEASRCCSKKRVVRMCELLRARECHGPQLQLND